MDKDQAFELVARHLDLTNYDRGVYENELTAGLDLKEKSMFISLLNSFEKEGIIDKKRGLVFIGNNYESQLSIFQNNSSNNVLNGNVFNGSVQIGNSNQMQISETDLITIERIIESLAKQEDPSLADSILNISNKTKDTYKKIKEWIGIFT